MPHLQAILAIVALSLTLATAHQSRSAKAVIYNPSDTYEYHGCYNETTDIAGTSGARALSGGSSLLGQNMTVSTCLDFCSSNGTQYKYAGLEWSKECWCADDIAAVSERMDDSNCSLACSGNGSRICGGSLKLTIYEYSIAPLLGPQISGMLLTASIMIVLVLF